SGRGRGPPGPAGPVSRASRATPGPRASAALAFGGDATSIRRRRKNDTCQPARRCPARRQATRHGVPRSQSVSNGTFSEDRPMKRQCHRSGFTLIELLVVIAIIAVLI